MAIIIKVGINIKRSKEADERMNSGFADQQLLDRIRDSML